LATLQVSEKILCVCAALSRLSYHPSPLIYITWYGSWLLQTICRVYLRYLGNSEQT